MESSEIEYKKENIRLNGNRKIERSDLNFDIEKKHLFVKNDDKLVDLSGGRKSENKCDKYALWDSKNNNLLAVISSKYNAVPHGEILNSLDDAMGNLNIEPIFTMYQATPNKNMMWADIQMQPKEAIFKDGRDDWNIGVTITHGLDGQHGLGVSSFVERIVCANGLRVQNLLGRVHITHRTSDMVGWFEKTITDTLLELDKKFDIIPKMYEINIEIETFQQKVEKILGKRFSEMVHSEIKNPSQTNPLYSVSEKKISLYDAMSAMTYINTHKDEMTQTARPGGSRVIAGRHYKIEQIINGYMPKVIA